MVVKMAECAKWGGAVGLRLNSPEQIRKVKEANLGLPIIGLYKVWHEDTDVFITPTMKEVDEIVALERILSQSIVQHKKHMRELSHGIYFLKYARNILII